MVDTMVQPKAIADPTDARLCHRALEKLVDLAERNGVRLLRQSYRWVAKRAAIMLALAVRVRFQDHRSAAPRSMRCMPRGGVHRQR